jgi:hypothetical protein
MEQTHEQGDTIYKNCFHEKARRYRIEVETGNVNSPEGVTSYVLRSDSRASVLEIHCIVTIL